MTSGITLKRTKSEFIKANRHKKYIVQKVEFMSEEEFQKFIEPYYTTFSGFFQEEVTK